MTAPNPLYQEGYSMTDTTDQQAVTVAQEAADWLRAISDWLLANDHDMTLPGGTLDTDPLDLADRLASVSSASAEPRKGTVAFVQEWLMNSDYDPTQFDKGFAAAIDARHGFDDAALTAIAERFCAAPLPDTVCADLVAIKPMAGRSGTNLMTVAEAKAVLRSIFPEPVPATNQAGEVARLRAALLAMKSEVRIFSADRGNWLTKNLDQLVAALATQPATSQEGTARDAVAWLRAKADGFREAAKRQERRPGPRANAFDDAAAVIEEALCAATPTPPTLSEDLRAALEQIAGNNWKDPSRARHVARAALAQVKAS